MVADIGRLVCKRNAAIEMLHFGIEVLFEDG